MPTNRLAQSMRAELIEHFRKMEELDALRSAGEPVELPPPETIQALNPIAPLTREGTELDAFWVLYGLVLFTAVWWRG